MAQKLIKTRKGALAFYKKYLESGTPKQHRKYLRAFAKGDLFFLLVFILNRQDLNDDWHFARCREVQTAPNGYLDLWFREAGKSSIITYGLTILDILNNPELTVGIFSCTRPIAKAFLRQIKTEFESNGQLLTLFPEIFYKNPKKESPKWSETDGIIVKRKTNPKESTVEAWGLVDGSPTSKHFQLIVYDDVVTRESVSSSEMIGKTNNAWELSRNLTTKDGLSRYIGTRYHYNDTYSLIMERQAAKPRIYTATTNGKMDGPPTLWTKEVLATKVREMGTFVAAAQLFQQPNMKSVVGFHRQDLRFWGATNLSGLNKYILVDPASKKTKRSDYSVLIVVGYGSDENYYVIDIIRDKLSLSEKGATLMRLHRSYKPLVVAYEQYGMQADIAYLEERMSQENYRFSITPVGGRVSKEDRIMTLLPVLEAHRLYLPDTCYHTNYLGEKRDLVRDFISNELEAWPFCKHDDMLDALARINDKKVHIIPPASREYGPLQAYADNNYDPLA